MPRSPSLWQKLYKTMENESYPDSPDVYTVDLNDRKIILVGTAHISRNSVDLVKKIILKEKPDHICLELDENRYNTLTKKKSWESLNFLQVIKKKQLTTLMVSLILSSYQKKLGRQTGISPGSEFLEADKLAKEKSIPVSFSDRDARITLKRAWRKTPFFKKMLLLGNLLASFFEKTEISEASISELKKSDIITEMIKELGRYLPTLKQVLIDERDYFIAEKINEVNAEKIVAVVGAGHMSGIKKALTDKKDLELNELSTIPPPSPTGKIISWSVPVLIILAVIFIGYLKGFESAKENIIFWIAANGSFCALGALAALSHPLTILTAFIAAPITSLIPVIGAGYVTVLVQALVSPPSVKEIQNAGTDFYLIKNWWKNKTLKVFLSFLLPGLGSFIGTWIGGYEILSNLLS